MRNGRLSAPICADMGWWWLALGVGCIGPDIGFTSACDGCMMGGGEIGVSSVA